MNQSSAAAAAAEDRHRARRQSRQSREFVSSQGSSLSHLSLFGHVEHTTDIPFGPSSDVSTSAMPTAEWQDQLLRRLSAATAPDPSRFASPAVTAYSASSSAAAADQPRYPPSTYSSSSGATSPVVTGSNVPSFSGQQQQPSKRRRRIESPLATSSLLMREPHAGARRREVEGARVFFGEAACMSV